MELKIACTGYEIAVDWLEGRDTSKILIVLPGYSASKARQKSHAEAMVQNTGSCAVVVDFSGHGVSPFELRDTRPAQHLLELICVFDWTKQQYPDAAVSVSGSSYGGFLAAQLTQYREFNNLVLRAPALYRPEAFYDPWSLRIDNLQRYDKAAMEYRHDSEMLVKHPLFQHASRFKGNVLVVVHEKDEVVPAETTNAYIAGFGADSIVAEGFIHAVDKSNVDESQIQYYQDQISNWLNKH